MPDDLRLELDPNDRAHLLHDVKAFDRELAKALTRRIRAVVKPLGEHTIREAAAGLPKSGGLADRVAASRMTISTLSGVKRAGVRLRLRTREGYALDRMDRGTIRHPYWGRWARGSKPQSIRAGLFTQAFQQGQAQARDAVEQAVVDAARTIHGAEVHR